jgi:hypothetical protein
LIGGRNNNNNNSFQNDRQLFYKSSPPSSTSSINLIDPPPYQTRDLHNSLMQQQQQQHHHVQNNGFDIDSHSSNLSLPSPSTSHYDSIHSPQQHHSNGLNGSDMQSLQSSSSTTPSPQNAISSTIQNVSKSLKSKQRVSAAAKLNNLITASALSESLSPIVADAKVNVLQQRVSKFC